MASSSKKSADPLLFLEVKPLCAYPHMQKFIDGLPLDAEHKEKLLVELHIFEHELLANGFRLYSAVGRDVGAQVLEQALTVFTEEYSSWLKGRSARS
jgi:hypothetical protein